MLQSVRPHRDAAPLHRFFRPDPSPGYRVPEELENDIRKRIELPYLGRISHDQDVEQFVLEGKSLLDTPSESPAFKSVKNILMKAGY